MSLLHMMQVDFEKLRAKRNAAVTKAIQEMWGRLGGSTDEAPVSNFDPNACYCACSTGGPCEHNWSGWREFEDGCGGEQVCSRCGCGAMSHSMGCGE